VEEGVRFELGGTVLAADAVLVVADETARKKSVSDAM
jgi:hypothetical protein